MPKLTKVQLINKLNECAENFNGDPETAHSIADSLLLMYIHDRKVLEAWSKIEKWYA